MAHHEDKYACTGTCLKKKRNKYEIRMRARKIEGGRETEAEAGRDREIEIERESSRER